MTAAGGPAAARDDAAGTDGAPAAGPPVVVRAASVVDAARIARLDGLSASTRRALERDLVRAAGPDAEVVVLVAVAATDHLGARAADEDPGRDPTLLGAALGQVLVDEGHVVDLTVDPAYRGHGIGRQLLEALLVGLRERGAVAHTLEVRPSNLAALGLYRAFGFVVEGRRPGYYPDGEDALLLWRRHEDRRR